MSETGDGRDVREARLTGTLRFVLVMGIVYAIGWLGMFALLRDRW